MKYLDLIGLPLKHDVLNDLFETYEVEVVYEYDRTHENMADEYRAEVPDLGLEFIFDAGQKLSTLFMEQKEINTFNPFEERDERLKKFDSKNSARAYAEEKELKVTEGNADFMGEEQDWIRFDLPKHSIHYQYTSGKLKKITLQNVKA